MGRKILVLSKSIIFSFSTRAKICTNYILSGKIRNIQKLHDPNNNIEENLEKNDMSNQTKLLSQKSNVDPVTTLGDYRELPHTS